MSVLSTRVEKAPAATTPMALTHVSAKMDMKKKMALA